jgi:hypothetical protein
MITKANKTGIIGAEQSKACRVAVLASEKA